MIPISVITPKEAGQILAGVRSVSMEQKTTKQLPCLARLKAFELAVVMKQAELSEEANLE